MARGPAAMIVPGAPAGPGPGGTGGPPSPIGLAQPEWHFKVVTVAAAAAAGPLPVSRSHESPAATVTVTVTVRHGHSGAGPRHGQRVTVAPCAAAGTVSESSLPPPRLSLRLSRVGPGVRVRATCHGSDPTVNDS